MTSVNSNKGPAIQNRVAVFFDQNYTITYFAAIVIQIIGMIIAYSIFGVVIAQDSQSYMEPALNFLAHGVFRYSNGSPILFRTPGYPFILAVIYAVSGESNFAVVLIQMMMSIFTGCFICGAVKRVTDSRLLGLGGLYLWTVCIMNYYYACAILTEIPFIFFFIMAVYFALSYMKMRKLYFAASAVLAVNAALLIRPAITYICILLAIILPVLVLYRKLDWKVALIYLCVFAAVFGGWSFRNKAYYGDALFSSVRYSSYYKWYAPLTYQIEEGGSMEEACEYFEELLYEKYPDFDELDELGQALAHSDIGHGYTDEHMKAYLLLNLKGLGLEMIGPGKTTIDAMGLPSVINYILYAISSGIPLAVYLIYAVGFLGNLKRLKAVDWSIFLINAYMMAGHAVLGYSRYRMSFFATCVIGAMISLRKEFIHCIKRPVKL